MIKKVLKNKRDSLKPFSFFNHCSQVRNIKLTTYNRRLQQFKFWNTYQLRAEDYKRVEMDLLSEISVERSMGQKKVTKDMHYAQTTLALLLGTSTTSNFHSENQGITF